MKSRLFAALLSFALTHHYAQGQSYNVTDLGAGLGAGSHAQAINNKGQVVGYWRAPDGMHAFLYDSGAVKDLGNLGGTNIYALSINDSGQVAGVAETVSGMQAFVYQKGSLTSLGTLGGINSYAYAINNLNQIVGYIDTPSGARAYVYKDGAKIELGTLGGTNSFGYSVNTKLQVAGTSLTFDNHSLHAFFWQTNAILDLNRLLAAPNRWELQEARAINESGQIVGSGILDEREHAFLYNAGAVVDIGVLPGGTNSYALGVNKNLEVVGASSTPAGVRAFIWHGGSMLDLNNLLSLSPGWELLEASGINDLGQVVGLASVNGQEHAFLISTVTANASADQDGNAHKFGVRPRVGGSLTVTITNPVPAAVFSIPTNITISADASDSVGTVTQVQFFAGTTLLGSATTSPYSVTWSNATVGTYSLTAVASDDASLIATSSVVNITVTLPEPGAIKLWLRADAGTILNGSTLATWQDQSGSANNATQSVSANQPTLVAGGLNSLPIVRFNGANTYLNLPNLLNGATQAEAFVVLRAQTNSPPNQKGLWKMGTFGFLAALGYPTSSGQIVDDFGSTSANNIGVPAQSLTQYHLYEVAGQSGKWMAWINGVLQASLTGNTFGYSTTPYLGQSDGYSYFAGDIAEVLIFNQTLAPTERQAVNGYLNGKYGLVPAQPAAPTNLVANAISPTQIGLSWNDSFDNGGTRVSIERKSGSGGTYAEVAQLSDTTSFVDTNLSSGTTYYYRVRAITVATWSDYSNEAQATTLGSGSDVPLGELALWLKADTGLARIGTNATVGFWADQSSRGNNASQLTGANQPAWVAGALNGQPIVRFNGANTYLNLPNLLNGATQAEAFVVLRAQTNSPANQKGLWKMGTFGFLAALGYPTSNGQIVDDFGSTSANNIGVLAQSLTQYHLYEVAGQSGKWMAWINGVLQASLTGNTFGYSTTPYLGQSDGYSYFAGDIAEVLIFNQTLAPTERQAVNGYLNGKYGLVPAQPAAPTNLVANAISPTQIGLSWNDSFDNGGTRVSIERKSGSGGTYAEVAQLSDTTSFVDTNLSSGTTYYYRVRAITVATWSDYSNEAQATTLGSGSDVPLGELALWLKADTGLARIGTNATVGFWADQSSRGNNASQLTGANQPAWVAGALNGQPIVRFNGANTYLNLPNLLNGATQAEAFVVLRAQTNSPANQKGLWKMGTYGYLAVLGYPNTGGQIVDDFGSTSANNIGVPAQSLTQYHLYQVAGQSGSWMAWINGMLQASSTGNTFGYSTTPYLGQSDGYSYFAGDIAEVLIFNQTLASTERHAVNGYLNGKYGLVPVQPAAPTNLVANAISPTQINLTWSNTTTVLAEVQIERKTDIAGAYAVIAEVGVGVSSYSDLNPPSGHRYFYRVRASNLAGYSPYSNEAGVTINQLPSVALTTPTNGAVFVSPANIPLAATASDSDGTVTNVTFFVGGTTNLGSVGSAPYSLTWSNVLRGTYVLSASATDNLGGVTTSTSVSITVSNPPPTVALIAPTNNQFYLAPAIITLTANASDQNGTVAKVDFYFSSTNLIGTATTSPYSIQWTNLVTGNYALTAVATDNEGAISTSAVVNISVSNTPPTVSITGPTNNTLFQALATIPITASASDPNGTVAKVEFFYGGTNKIGEAYTSPFSIVWSNVVAGTNSITAKATDNGGASTISSAVTVIINAQPTVSITSPANNASFGPATNITINATAADVDGTISKVDFYYGLNNLIGTDTSSPYSIVLSNAPFGTYPLTAKATDNRGGVTVSSPVTVSVGTNFSDVADSYVHDGTSASSNFGTATSLLVETNTAGNNSDTYFKFNAAGIINVTSAKLNIYAAVSNTKDTLGVTACGTSTNWTETGITWNNRPALGSIIASTNISGRTFAWYTLDVTSYVQAQKAAGSNVFSLALHATNSTSGNVSLNSKEASANQPYLQLFASNNPPTVTISSPTNYAFFTPGTNISISASASDADGSIFQVQFFQGTTSLGIKSSSPYTVTWTNAPPGAYALSAVATDNYGASTTSGAIYVIVQTNPYVSDSDGDGIPDAWEAMFGLNPTVNDLGQSGERSNYGYTPADWFNQVSGIKTGTVNLDKEGNVLQVSQ